MHNPLTSRVRLVNSRLISILLKRTMDCYSFPLRPRLSVNLNSILPFPNIMNGLIQSSYAPLRQPPLLNAGTEYQHPLLLLGNKTWHSQRKKRPLKKKGPFDALADMSVIKICELKNSLHLCKSDPRIVRRYSLQWLLCVSL